jgi:hypothetical protein
MMKIFVGIASSAESQEKLIDSFFVGTNSKKAINCDECNG